MTTMAHLKTTMKTPAPNKQKSYLYLPWIHKRSPTSNFVLNCDSQEWKLPEYNSLQDKNLYFYFANPSIRNVLQKNGVVDAQGNITNDKKTIFTAKHKLPPISENVNPNVQRLVAPYRNSKSKAAVAKLAKYPSAPQKRVSLMEHSHLAPKKSQTLLLKPKVLTSTRKVQPLTKEQLEQVFAKYQVKTVAKKEKTNDTDSMSAEERSTDCRDKKSESSPERVQPQNEVPQDFAVKKLDFVAENETMNMNLDEVEVLVTEKRPSEKSIKEEEEGKETIKIIQNQDEKDINSAESQDQLPFKDYNFEDTKEEKNFVHNVELQEKEQEDSPLPSSKSIKEKEKSPKSEKSGRGSEGRESEYNLSLFDEM